MKTILVVDDDRHLRTIVQRALALSGYQVHETSNGFDALRLLDQLHPDLVITDVYMPDMDGIEFVRKAKQGINRPEMIVMSGGGNMSVEAVLEIATKLGARQTLRKPFSTDELLQAVTAVFKETGKPNS